MNDRTPKTAVRILWWFFLLLSLVMLGLSLPGYFSKSQNLFRELPSPADTFAVLQNIAHWSSAVFSIFATLVSIVLAVIVYRSKPDDRMAVFFSFYLLFYAIFMSGPIEVVNAYWLPDQPNLALRLQSVFFSLPNLVLLLVFPNGRFEPRWSRVVVWLGIVFTVGALFMDSEQLMRPSTIPGFLIISLLYGLLMLSLGVQMYRYFKLYTYAERQQVKWAFFGILAWMVGIALSSIPYYYLLNLPPDATSPWWAPVGSALWFLTLAILPVSFTIAILRSRLWDIDLLVRRTLLYSLLTGLLSLVYFGGVALMQGILTADRRPTTAGETAIGSPPSAVIVLSTLLIAALFNPLRRRLQDFIDRRFYRQKYNAEHALADFAAAARSQTDLEQLSGYLAATVQETLQPEQVSLWLTPDAAGISERAADR